MYLIKYLKRTSLHIGLCLLLTCFANVASAQSFELNLANLQQNGLTIRFDVTFGSTLTGVQRIVPLISINGINDDDDIRSFEPLSNLQCSTDFFNVRRTGTRLYQFCLGEGTRATLELKLKNPNTTKNIVISIAGISSENLSSPPSRGIGIFLRPTVNPAIRVRSKVFLEDPSNKLPIDLPQQPVGQSTILRSSRLISLADKPVPSEIVETS